MIVHSASLPRHSSRQRPWGGVFLLACFQFLFRLTALNKSTNSRTVSMERHNTSDLSANNDNTRDHSVYLEAVCLSHLSHELMIDSTREEERRARPTRSINWSDRLKERERMKRKAASIGTTTEETDVPTDNTVDDSTGVLNKHRVTYHELCLFNFMRQA
jgi:hypothetical protein